MIKRTTDILAAFLILIILAPIMVVVAILVRAQLGSPVFFKQRRPGKMGKSFLMVKFRTMKSSLDSSGKLLPDSERLTMLGKFLRSTSLDELPELWNVLRGDMSLVGPRPLLLEYLPLYSRKQARRHEVRPGVTGWAQVNGRNTVTWEEKFELDVWYVDNQSFLLDFMILFKTPVVVFSSKGVSAKDNATMYRFEGSKNE